MSPGPQEFFQGISLGVDLLSYRVNVYSILIIVIIIIMAVGELLLDICFLLVQFFPFIYKTFLCNLFWFCFGVITCDDDLFFSPQRANFHNSVCWKINPFPVYVSPKIKFLYKQESVSPLLLCSIRLIQLVSIWTTWSVNPAPENIPIYWPESLCPGFMVSIS